MIITKADVRKMLRIAEIEATPWQVDMLVVVLNHKGPIALASPKVSCHCEAALCECSCGAWWCRGWVHTNNQPPSHGREISGSHFCVSGSTDLIAFPARSNER